VSAAPDGAGRPLPTVSVVIPTRNRPALLADALASVAAQRPAPLEVRIAADGDPPSDPRTASARLPNTVVVRAGAGHPGAARNRAAAGASGEVLAFLDDDDRWLPGHLEGLLRAFADPGVAVAYRDCVVVRERCQPGGARVDLERREIARDWDAGVMAVNDYVPPSALAVRRTAFEGLGGFDPSFAFSEDWDLLLRAAALRRPVRVPGVTVEVRMREWGNASADAGAERRRCLDRLSARHGLPALEIKTFWDVARDVAAAAPR